MEFRTIKIIFLSAIVLSILIFYGRKLYVKWKNTKPVSDYEKEKTDVDFTKKMLFWSRVKLMFTRNYSKLLIHMTLNTGGKRSFVVKIDGEDFCYGENSYVIDPKLFKYNHSMKMNELHYNQSVSIPYDISIIPVEIKRKTAQISNGGEVVCSINPRVLYERLYTNIAVQVMKANDIGDWIRQLKFLAIVTCIGVWLFFLVFAIKTGMLQQITASIPGF